MQRFTKLIMAAAAVGCSLFATNKASAQAQLGLYGAGYFPMGEFQSQGYTNGGGGGFSVLSPNLAGTDESKFFLQAGVGMDAGYFGRRKFNVALADSVINQGEAYIYNSTVALSGILRPSVVIGRWQPFVQVFAGGRWFMTDERIVPNTGSENATTEEETRETLLSRGSFTYGAGFGAMYRLNDIFSLELGIDYSMGGRTKYAVMDEIQQPKNEIDLKASYRDTKTDLLIVKFGVQITLSNCEDTGYEERGSSYENNNSSTPSYTPPASRSMPRNVIKPDPKPAY